MSKLMLKIIFKQRIRETIQQWDNSEKTEKDSEQWLDGIVNAEEAYITGLIDLEKLKNE